MPIHEYVCTSCGHEFEELLRSTSDKELESCPVCHDRTLSRKLSVFAARHGESRSVNSSPGDECSRCRDSNGPCFMQG